MSTGNLTKHAKSCWSVEAVQAASARPYYRGFQAGECWRKAQLLNATAYTHAITVSACRLQSIVSIDLCGRLHTVRWVCGSTRPFDIVEDEEYLELMKTGRPEYQVTSAKTLARDVRRVGRMAGC